MEISKWEARLGKIYAFLASCGNISNGSNPWCVDLMFVPFGNRTLIGLLAVFKFNNLASTSKKCLVAPVSATAYVVRLMGEVQTVIFKVVNLLNKLLSTLL